ncbi:MAG: hypothetical protein ACTSPB_01385 [Candidatus Thorarchaeota archaeon]
MSDVEITKKLTKIGMLYLKSNGCFIVAPEAKVRRTMGSLVPDDLDNHKIIDLLGVGKKYIPYDKQVEDERGYRKTFFEILRGVEIKVSRSDFKRGFIQSGCNYHYLMFPKGLIERDEVPTGVGVVSVDIDSFMWSKWGTRLYLHGVETLRRPRFQKISDRDFNHSVRHIGKLCSDQMIRWARDDLREKR